MSIKAVIRKSALNLAHGAVNNAPIGVDSDDDKLYMVPAGTGSTLVSIHDSATTSIEVIGRDQLDIAPPAGLGDMLAGVPGLRSSSFGPGASRPVVRGLAGPRVLVLNNGVGLVDASALSPDHQVASDPGEAQRIEGLRGPAALLYGGSAIGGVVNVIDDRIARRAPEAALSGRLNGSAGSGCIAGTAGPGRMTGLLPNTTYPHFKRAKT